VPNTALIYLKIKQNKKLKEEKYRYPL